MKAIKYTMTNGLEAQVAILKSVDETLKAIKNDMQDPAQYEVIEIEEVQQDETITLKSRLEHLESTLEELLFGTQLSDETNEDEEPIF